MKIAYTLLLLCAYITELYAMGHMPIEEVMRLAEIVVNRREQSAKIFEAIEKKNKVEVNNLIKYNVDLTLKNNHDMTPLMYASECGHAEIAQLLIKAGAQVNEYNDHWQTPLICASEKGHTEVMQLLINAGAKVNAYHKNWWTPLMYAVSGTHVDAVRLLIAAKANVNARNFKGHTALDIAVQWSSKEMEDLLKKHGAQTGNTCIIS